MLGIIFVPINQPAFQELLEISKAFL